MTQPKTKQIRVSPEVAKMADELATHRGESAPEMLTRILLPILKRELEKHMERRLKELKGQQDKE